MLETKHLSKIYKPKKGVPVKALDDVSICFPDTGMVFLLGKSGSGKSTLLNLLGGLDKYDAGDITIKGVSSKDFKQKHFDSYRNTYVGFIFQEYNILDEFTVGANIALALELQGQKASDERINEILRQVDLEGFGARRPNELSGGQKQRVAIARALVKRPEIIMADEPTGALDSNTGKQVLDTLKKLSGDKLVIIVSHDREFAENYADRIIELSDGRVISDMEYSDRVVEEETGLRYEGNRISIPENYHLTEQDREQINEYLKKLSSGAVMESVSVAKRAVRKTDTDKIKRQKDGSFQLIKSRLPMKNAFKIGAGGLKYKKFRLVITILLSCVAFGLFGLADTFGAYNHIKTCTNSLMDSNIHYASIGKNVRRGSEDYYWYDSDCRMKPEDMEKFSKTSGVAVKGVFKPKNSDLNFDDQYDTEVEFTKTDYHIYPYGFNGFMETDQTYLKNMNVRLLAGKLPEGDKNEIAISAYICKTFEKAGWRADVRGKFQKIASAKDMVGKTLMLNGATYTVTGVFDTGFDLSRYQGLTEEKLNQSNADALLDYALFSELTYARNYGLDQVVLVGKGLWNRLIAAEPTTRSTVDCNVWLEDGDNVFSVSYAGTLQDVPADAIIWTNGAKLHLSENEIIVDDSSDARAMKKPTLSVYQYYEEDAEQVTKDCTIVGYLDTEKYPALADTMLVHEKYVSMVTNNEDGVYDYCIGAMPEKKEDIQTMVTACYEYEEENPPVKYSLMNAVTYELDAVNEFLKIFAKAFLYIGLFFAVFAAIMLANFIGTSISYKKQEIGILRAIGSRSSDVFRIFFSESFIIAGINFLLSAAGVCVVTVIINVILRYECGILITVLHFGLRQIALLFAVSMLIAFLASFIPVKRIASKKPIDAIRSR